MFVRGPAVAPSSLDVTSSTIEPDDCTAVIEYRTDGNEWVNDGNGGGIATVNRNTWLTRGSASEVWIERTFTGTLNEDFGAGRQQVTSTKRLTAFRDGTISGAGATSATVTVNFYDAASGGNLLGSATFDLIAEITI